LEDWLQNEANIEVNHSLRWLAGGRGFEPRLTGPEPAVLPLDDPPMPKSIVVSEKARVKPIVSYRNSNLEQGLGNPLWKGASAEHYPARLRSFLRKFFRVYSCFQQSPENIFLWDRTFPENANSCFAGFHHGGRFSSGGRSHIQGKIHRIQ
jgi:hypothetical protein